MIHKQRRKKTIAPQERDLGPQFPLVYTREVFGCRLRSQVLVLEDALSISVNIDFWASLKPDALRCPFCGDKCVFLFVLITSVGALYSVYVCLHYTLCIIVKSLSLFPI